MRKRSKGKIAGMPKNGRTTNMLPRQVSVVIPAYNEEESILAVLSETDLALKEIGVEYEIIVVNDGSTDGTRKALSKAKAGLPSLITIDLPENLGKGNAFRRGFQASRYDLVCCLDADLDLHPEQIGALIRRMAETDADIVIGSKRHPDSVLNYPTSRKIYSSCYYLLISALFRLPLKDTQTGLKLYRREVLETVLPRLVSMQYVLDLELLAVANRMGYRIAEIPVTLSFQREFGRIRFSDVRGIIVDTMSIFYRFYVLGYYGSPLKDVKADEPRVSIVVPTREIDPMVKECVSKCLELNYSNFDIQLVPDEPTEYEGLPEGSAVIASGAVGPSFKRNLAVENSNAEIIAFIDGDAYPAYDWLKHAVAYFDDEGVASIGGPAVTPPSDNRRQQASGAVYSASLVSWSTKFRYRPHAFREIDDHPTVNLLVRKSDFEKAGGFSEEYWPGEDTELCLRLVHQLKKRILYVPNVLVYHHRRPLFRGHLRQVYAYAQHRGFFVRKHPENSRHLQYFVPSLFVIGLVAGGIASLFSTPVLWVYFTVLLFYLALVLLSSIKTLDPLTNLLVIPGIISTHIVYGIGFIKGLLSRKMKMQ